MIDRDSVWRTLLVHNFACMQTPQMVGRARRQRIGGNLGVHGNWSESVQDSSSMASSARQLLTKTSSMIRCGKLALNTSRGAPGYLSDDGGVAVKRPIGTSTLMPESCFAAPVPLVLHIALM